MRGPEKKPSPPYNQTVNAAKNMAPRKASRCRHQATASDHLPNPLGQHSVEEPSFDMISVYECVVVRWADTSNASVPK